MAIDPNQFGLSGETTQALSGGVFAAGAREYLRPAKGWQKRITAALLCIGGATLFGPGAMAWKPELKLRARCPLVPAFNGELTTAGDRRLYDAVGAYALLEMHRNYFEEWEAGGAPEPAAAWPSPQL